MIRQITVTYSYTKKHVAFITSLGVLSGHEWDNSSKGFAPHSAESVRRNKGMAKLKDFIRKKLELSHKQTHGNITEIHCAFCGLRLNITSNDEIEHFSPKAKSRTPQWMFLQENLLLACHLCNGPKRKGNKKVTDSPNIQYGLSQFKIVHPRLHDPDKHYAYSDPNKLVMCKAKSSKEGKQSIKWFKLDKDAMTQARINEFNEQAFKIDKKTGKITYDSSFAKKHFS